MYNESMPEETKKPEVVSPEAEIKELERRLEQKKRELAEKEIAPPAEKEIFREVLREHIEEKKSAPPGQPVFSPLKKSQTAADFKKKQEDDLKKEEREEQIKSLIEVALTKTIAEAVKVAESAGPYLLDELHDRLVDDYYDKLLALRKLKPL